jgi:hypothetical protein
MKNTRVSNTLSLCWGDWPVDVIVYLFVVMAHIGVYIIQERKDNINQRDGL